MMELERILLDSIREHAQFKANKDLVKYRGDDLKTYESKRTFYHKTKILEKLLGQVRDM